MKKKTKTNKTPSAILCSDLHVRETTPIARTDDYFKTQEDKLQYLKGVYKESVRKAGCIIPLIIAGDLCHKSRLPKWFDQYIAQILAGFDSIIAIPGNHDLPNHSLELIYDSSIGIISGLVGSSFHLYYTPLETFYSIDIDGRKVGVIHQLVHKEDPVMAGDTIISTRAKKVLKENSFDLIVSGDNHQSFVEEYQGKILVNPGSMMRMTAGNVDYEPSFYIYYAEDNSVERCYFPIAPDVIDRSHIDIKDEYDERMVEFVNKMTLDFETELSFEKNLEAYFKVNETKKSTIKKVWECVK